MARCASGRAGRPREHSPASSSGPEADQRCIAAVVPAEKSAVPRKFCSALKVLIASARSVAKEVRAGPCPRRSRSKFCSSPNGAKACADRGLIVSPPTPLKLRVAPSPPVRRAAFLDVIGASGHDDAAPRRCDGRTRLRRQCGPVRCSRSRARGQSWRIIRAHPAGSSVNDDFSRVASQPGPVACTSRCASRKLTR
mgnify:CR=1 FL=1